MTNTSTTSRRDFQRNIYTELDSRLRDTAFDSGASEAHGVLCGLACRGVTKTTLSSHFALFRLSEYQETLLIEGLFEILDSDLESDHFEFNLLLPDDDASLYDRVEALSDWCEGFIQGICHDGESALRQTPTSVQEAVDDMLQITHIHADLNDNEENERSLFEIEEYLRVAAKLIFEELNADRLQASAEELNTQNGSNEELN